MKLLIQFLFTFICILSVNSFAQGTTDAVESAGTSSDAYKELQSEQENDNRGLYISGSFGANSTKIKCSPIIMTSKNSDQLSSVICPLYDIRMGISFNKKAVLHLTYINANSIRINNSSPSYISTFSSITEQMYGAGLTYYFPPKNLFISGSLGLGTIALYYNENKKYHFDRNSGISIQAKAGFERNISRKLAVGICVSLLKSYINTGTLNEQLEWNNTHYTISANFTYK